VQCKSGKSNVVVNALNRSPDLLVMLKNVVVGLNSLKEAYETDGFLGKNI
jgi:hypothetical protein